MLEAARMPSPDDLAGIMLNQIGKKKEAEELSKMTPEDIAKRCKNLKETITENLFDYLRRGLFEKDKLTVASLLAFTIQKSEGRVSGKIVDCMVNNIPGSDLVPMTEEVASWLPENLWNRLKGLEEQLAVGEDKLVPFFEEICDKFCQDAEEWETWYNHNSPESHPMPGEFGEVLSGIEKMLILRALRPDRVSFALQAYLAETMGKR